ncbi:MAG TPA: GAF domain-containing protein, partial [Vicinamibacterales bacterium]|nr:GAF domain-containing protein [Vicinamibacterales bacterium]
MTFRNLLQVVPAGLWWIVLVRLTVVGAMIAVIVRLVQSRRRERAATRRWATLSKVTARLAETLHADTTLEDVARLLVPEFADWCSMHVVEDGGVQRAAVVHADAAVERRLRERLAGAPFVADAPVGPALVIRTGKADLHRDGSAAASVLTGRLGAELLHEAGIGSLLSVPLRTHQQTVGALTLHRRMAGAYDDQDLEWAGDLARQIALAVENTRLYEDAKRLFEQSASANWVSTADGRIVACNQMFAHLLGFESIDDVRNTPATELYADPADRDRLIEELVRD